MIAYILKLNTHIYQYIYKPTYITSLTKALAPTSFLRQETPDYKDLNEESHDSQIIVYLTVFYILGSSQHNDIFVKFLSFTINMTKVRGKQ